MPDRSEDPLVVIRFSPFTATGMAKNIEGQKIRDEIAGITPTRLGVSVFGARLRDEESIDELVVRLVDQVKDHAGGSRLAVATERSLNLEGYHLHLIEPPPGHYLVGTAVLSDMPDTVRLAEIFSRDVRKTPVVKKG